MKLIYFVSLGNDSTQTSNSETWLCIMKARGILWSLTLTQIERERQKKCFPFEIFDFSGRIKEENVHFPLDVILRINYHKGEGGGGVIYYYIRISVSEWYWCKSNSSLNYLAIYSENEFHCVANEGGLLSLFPSENQQSSALDMGNYTLLLVLTSVSCWNGKLRQDSNHLISDSHGRCSMRSGSRVRSQ